MKNKNILNGFEKVIAPKDFEIKLMEKLAFYKRKREKRIKYFKICLVTAAAFLFIYISLNFLFFKGNEDAISTKIYEEENVLPITEIINYSGELNELSNGKKTIYILEQISDREEIYF
jgi:hypothetical protein